ncbi:hypothetical protein MINS_34600 [Mycolicibacterium insubricum]|jgi:hypothetical protein|nr:hypothetical protein [Mycolicibacterium insubricum]MCV7082991.1 hypothetical protein [Mycolicibacterium insubricum]BBZ68031.1 hypothetical protein MINS_34600 [Mycolicibacterium insubricum]
MTSQTTTRELPVADSPKYQDPEGPIYLQAWFLMAVAFTIFGIVLVAVN